MAASTAAGISLLAASVAIWQARSASSQAESARRAADATYRQALAAERQAAASEGQLDLSQAQLTALSSDLHERIAATERNAVTDAVRTGWIWKGEAESLVHVRATAYAHTNPEGYRSAEDNFRAAIVIARSTSRSVAADATLVKLLKLLDEAPHWFDRLKDEDIGTTVSKPAIVQHARKYPRDVGLLLRDLEWHVTEGARTGGWESHGTAQHE